MEQKANASNLPEHWDCLYSNSQKRNYYFNSETGESQWHVPIPVNVVGTKRSRDETNIEEKQDEKQDEKQEKKKRTSIDDDGIRVAIIVPFRDDQKAQKRTSHLQKFIPHMETLFSKTNVKSYRIFIMEQSCDGMKFNRGKLLNCGFDLAKDNYDLMIFHDVDLLPSLELKEWYVKLPGTKESGHIAKVWDRYTQNPKYYGGIVTFSTGTFQNLNGYPNTFWGWGGEDDELYKRVIKCGIKIVHPKEGSIIDLEDMNLKEKLTILKKSNWKCMVKWELLNEHEKLWRVNGLSDLKYTIVERKEMGDKCSRITIDLGRNGHWSDEKAQQN